MEPILIDNIVDKACIELVKTVNTAYTDDMWLPPDCTLLICEYAIDKVCLIPDLISDGSLILNKNLFNQYWQQSFSKYYNSRISCSPIIDSDSSFELLLIQRGILISKNSYILPTKYKNMKMHINIKFSFIGNIIDFLSILPHTHGIKSKPDISSNFGNIDTSNDNAYSCHFVQTQWTTPGLHILNSRMNLQFAKYDQTVTNNVIYTIDLIEDISDDNKINVNVMMDNDQYTITNCLVDRENKNNIGSKIAIMNRENKGCILAIHSLSVGCIN